MELRVLGPVEVVDAHGEPIELPGIKAQTVLATLALADGQAVSDTRLSSMLWSWYPPSTMTAQIYTHVSRLRKRLGPDVQLIRRPRGYQLRAECAELDLHAFERSARAGRAALARRHYREASDRLGSALARYRGTVLGNVTEYLAQAEQPRLEELRLAALEDRIEAELALGRHHGLVPELTALLSDHPLRERFRAQLMTALYRCDRQSDALALFQTGRRLLAEELGIDPGATLVAVHQAVLEGRLPGPDAADAVVAGVGSVPEPVVPEPLVPAMLPPDVADFTSRSAESARLAALLDPDGEPRPRRVLITGMAGVGKSALAVHVAHRLRDRFPDGRLYADLAAGGLGQHPGAVLLCFLHALGVDPAADQRDLPELVRIYRTHIAERRLLVLLDNAERDSEIAPLLPVGPDSAALVTSRRHLVFASDRDCLELAPFAERESTELLAAVAGPERIAADPAAAREITRQCAGLPLAVRIAGVRLASRPQWTAASLARRLARRDTRLDELSFGELRVRDSIRRSLRQVSLQGRQMLPRLAVFETSAFPVEAAARELRMPQATAEQLLEELADVRLLEAVPAGARGGVGYRMHELVLLSTGTRRPAPRPGADRRPTRDLLASRPA